MSAAIPDPLDHLECPNGDVVAAISRWIDTSPGYVALDWEAHLWRRCMKVVSEVGEAHDALGGMLGENPRKGITHTLDDLIGELLDVAVAALGAVEHVTGNEGLSTALLAEKIAYVAHRAGLRECHHPESSGGTSKTATA